jgi:proline dehydrogenase
MTAALRSGLLWASRRNSLRDLITRLPVTKGLVRRFVSGETLDEALFSLRNLGTEGCLATIDVLGEQTHTADDAQSAGQTYSDVLAALAFQGFEPNISLKLSQLGASVDATLCRSIVRSIVEEADRLGGFVRIDMEDASLVDFTIDTCRILGREGLPVGAVIQSYLRRSPADVDALLAYQISVRLCKGAYAESEAIAFKNKVDVDRSYIELMEHLLLSQVRPAIATHDERMIEHAVEFATKHGVRPDTFDFEMLYGVRRDLQAHLVRSGFRLRVYVPYGPQWYPYFMRRLAERPANIAFVVKSLIKERRANRTN